MLLVPLLAVSEFKCQLNAYNFVTVTECFMRGFSTDRGPSHGTGVPPSALGSLSSWSVCDSSCESDSAAQPGPGVQLFLLSECDCACVHAPTPAWLWPWGTDRFKFHPNKHPVPLAQQVYVCMCVCVYVNVYLSPYTGKVCVTNIPILYTLYTHHLH